MYSEIKKAENVQREESEFIANMSHDIRSPLNNVKNILSLVRLEGIQDDSMGLIESALDNCDQMGEIVEDILDYSRFQLGRLTPRTGKALLPAAVRQW